MYKVFFVLLILFISIITSSTYICLYVYIPFLIEWQSILFEVFVVSVRMVECVLNLDDALVLLNGKEPTALVSNTHNIHTFLFTVTSPFRILWAMSSELWERQSVNCLISLLFISLYALYVCLFLLLCFSEDVDECALNRDKCDPLVQCVNYPGGYNCTSCPPGFNDAYQNGSWCIGIFFLSILIHNVFDSMLTERKLKWWLIYRYWWVLTGTK
jgi:hypothetical protein